MDNKPDNSISIDLMKQKYKINHYPVTLLKYFHFCDIYPLLQNLALPIYSHSKIATFTA